MVDLQVNQRLMQMTLKDYIKQRRIDYDLNEKDRTILNTMIYVVSEHNVETNNKRNTIRYSTVLIYVTGGMNYMLSVMSYTVPALNNNSDTNVVIILACVMIFFGALGIISHAIWGE